MGEASEQVTEKLMSKGLMAIPMIMNSQGITTQITDYLKFHKIPWGDFILPLHNPGGQRSGLNIHCLP